MLQSSLWAFFLKRLAWVIPTLLFVSIATFWFLSYVPDPSDHPEVGARLGPTKLQIVRRERFLGLPRFLNVSPTDVRTRVREAAPHVANDDDQAKAAARELVRLGAAGLPEAVAMFDAFGPEERARVAVALAPIAERMRLPNAADAKRPELAVRFWTRLWTDRGVEFQRNSARTAVARLARYRTSSRAREVEELDTFVLPEIFDRLTEPRTEAGIYEARVLVDVLAHVLERDDRIAEDATLTQARAVVARWIHYWFVYGTDYLALESTTRASALVLETRYGKWASSVVRGVVDSGGSPGLKRLWQGAKVTLPITFGAIIVAYGAAIVLGTVAAMRRKTASDIAIAAVVLGMYAVPTAVVAVLVHEFTGSTTSTVPPMLVVAVALVAGPTRHQRSGLLNALTSDYVRAARARGATQLRALLVHGLRTALVPVVTLATLEPPIALGASFVAERIFGVRGLGQMTIDAVLVRDVDFLMGLAMLFASIATALVVVADVGHAVLDPRMRHRLTRGRG